MAMHPSFGINYLGLHPGFAKFTCQAVGLNRMKRLIGDCILPTKMAVSLTPMNAPLS